MPETGSNPTATPASQCEDERLLRFRSEKACHWRAFLISPSLWRRVSQDSAGIFRDSVWAFEK